MWRIINLRNGWQRIEVSGEGITIIYVDKTVIVHGGEVVRGIRKTGQMERKRGQTYRSDPDNNITSRAPLLIYRLDFPWRKTLPRTQS